MNERRLSDGQIAAALRAHLPSRAQADLRRQVMEEVVVTSQERALPSFLGRLTDADPIARRQSLLIAVALLLAAALASAAAVGAWRLLQHETLPRLDLTPPADLQAFVLSAYDRMPQVLPVAITTLTDGSDKGRIYVDRSGAVRFEHYATPDAEAPDTYRIFNGTTMVQLAIVGSDKVWVEQQGAISEDPRVFLLAELEGDGAGNQPACMATRNAGEVGNGTAASGWTYVAAEYVIGRPTFHVTCGGGDLWIDIETRLILRSRGPARDASFQPVPGSSQTIEVTALEFGDQPAGLFAIAPPAGVARMSSEAYQCRIDPTACATPAPTLAQYTPPPGAILGPLPSLPPSRASNGWIAYSTSGHGRPPSSTDITTGSDLYLVRPGAQPRWIAGREGGTIRNECPVFSPDGHRLAYSVDAGQSRTLVVVDVDANGVITPRLTLPVPGAGSPPCPRWSSDGKRVAYLEGGSVVVRGLDGSTPASADGDPRVEDFGLGRQYTDPLLSPSGDWTARLSSSGSACVLVVARPDGTAAHVITLRYCPYAIAAWSPDGRQVLLMEDVSGMDFTMHALAIEGAADVTIVSTVRTNGARSWPGWGDVSWQPVLP